MSLQPSAASIVARDKRNRRTRNRRRLIAAGVVSGLIGFVFIGLPPIVRSQAVKRLSVELDREVAIEKIRINPFVFSVTIDGLVIKDRDGGPFTSWRRLYVNFDSFSLFTGEWRFQDIELDGFAQRVAIDKDGVFNFADLIAKKADAPADESVSADEDAAPRPLRITRLSVTSAALSFADASRSRPFATEVGPLSFELNNFLTTGDPKAPYAFSAVTEAGETFAWKGTVSIDPVRSAGEFTLGKIALKKYAPYYADFINADLLDGTLDVGARYAIDLGGETPLLTIDDGAVKLSTLQIAPRGSTTPVIDLPSITLEGLSADGAKPSAVIRRIALGGGAINVVRESDGAINLLALLAPPASSGNSAAPVSSAPAVQATPAASEPAPLPDVKLGEFALSGFAIEFEDRTLATPAKNSINRLDVSVRNVSLAEPAAPIALKLSLATPPDGTLDIEGTVAREPLAADLTVKLASFSLQRATPYVSPLVNIGISDGVLSVDGKARLTGVVANFQGDVIVDRFAVVDGARSEKLAAFAQLAILGIDAKSEPLSAAIDTITLAEPSANLVIYPDKTSNIQAILRGETPPPAGAEPEPEPAAEDASAPAPELVWSLNKFSISKGNFAFHDQSITPPVRLALTQFNGSVGNLSSANPKRGDLSLNSTVNGTGSVAITGKIDTRALTPTPGAVTEVTVDVKDVDLSPLSPYVGAYAGYKLERSGLLVDVKVNLGERRLDTDNVVTLKQFTLGEKTNSPTATTLPVRLGVALLKDGDGNIVIDLPVKGSLDDPEFRIGRVVMRVIGNLLTKAATSPFSLLSSAFGGGSGENGDDLAYQEFRPGSSELMESELKKIETLRKALKNRPALNLDIIGGFDPGADLAALRDQTLDRQVRYRRWQELRAENPDTPPASEITVSSEDEVRIIGTFVAERYPAGVPTVGPDGAIEPPPPRFQPLHEQVKTASEPEPKRMVAQRTHRGGVRFVPAPTKEEDKDSSAPVEVATSAESAERTSDGETPALPLAEARAALAGGIPINPDDLVKLADERARRVHDALLEGGEIDPQRISIVPPAPEGKAAKVSLELR